MTLFTAHPLRSAVERSSRQNAGLVRNAARLISPAAALVGIITLIGCALRLAAARGDLWLDELWSIDLVSHITSPDQVFWAISHDNNHFLTSLWIYAVGQHASPLVYRLPAIVLGTLTIPVAARIGGRVSTAGAVVAAMLAACSYPLVDYGSEARGYAGLILASLLAIELAMSALDTMAAEPSHAASRQQRWLLAIVIALGTCAHFTMVVEAALLGLAAIGRSKLAGRSARQAVDDAVGLFFPALLLLLPIAAAVGVGVFKEGQFSVGGQVQFTPEHWLEGFGGLLGTMLGLPPTLDAWAGPLIAVVLVIAGTRFGWLDRRWLPLALASLLLWPATVFAIRLPNAEHPRYFLAAGLALLVVLAEVAARLWARGGASRAAAAALVALVCAGQMPPVLRLLRDHRGAPSNAVALIGADGRTTFASQPGMNIEPIVETYATLRGVAVIPADRTDACGHPAEWLILDGDGKAPVPDLAQAGPAACRRTYGVVRVFPSALWSGQAWAVYRRKN